VAVAVTVTVAVQRCRAMAAVLVTGASTGIGEACALHLDRLGHTVFAGVRREADGERLADQASSLLQPVQLDVTDVDQVTAALDTVAEAVDGAGLAGLVNNAGTAMGGPVELLPLAEWRRQLEVNVIGQVAVTQAALPLLRTARGRVAFIGSVSGRISTPMMAPYCASKHAIEAIGESLREELRLWGMRVAVIEPGAIATPIWAKGRETAERLEALLGPEGERLYGAGMTRVRGMIDHQERVGIPPAKVAAAVEHALFAKRPKHRYPVGTDARVGALLDRLLPDRLLAVAVRRAGP
jgi:NAD(P)-dependent dehydrogenase (short-subunit alcohol dehydrogenase family)